MELLIGFIVMALALIGPKAIMSFKSNWMLVVVLVIPMASQASAFKCTDSAGKLTFSDTPCPSNAVKGEKVMGRGAGFNPLTPEEKGEFKRTMMAVCPAPRNVCECIGDTVADTLTYEEVMQTINNRGQMPQGAQEKAQSAGRSCAAMGTSR